MGRALAALLLVLFVAAYPVAGAIFPPVIGGAYTLNVLTAEVALDANGLPTEHATASIGVVDEQTGELYGCIPAAPGQTVAITYSVAPVPGVARVAAVVYAYADLECQAENETRERSEPSEEVAYHLFAPPGRPRLEVPIA